MDINGRDIITYIVATGTFIVSGMSIYLGYALFMAGAKGEFKILVGSWSLTSVAPGIAFAAFGAIIIWRALEKLVK